MASTSSSGPHHVNQPAPSPIRAHTHKQQRLFLGPLPAAFLTSDRVNTARRKYWNLGSKARKGSNAEDAGLVEDVTSPRALHFSLPGSRRARSDSIPRGLEEDFDTTIVQPAGPFFTIGQEFQEPTQPAPEQGDHGDDPISPPIILVNETILGKSLKGTHNDLEDEQPTFNKRHTSRPPPKPISRPSLYPRTTTDRLSYQTARSQIPAGSNTNNTASSSAFPGSTSRITVATPGTIATTRTGTTDFFSARSEVLLDPSSSDEDDDDKVTTTNQNHPESIKSSDPVLPSDYGTPLSASPAPMTLATTPTSPRFSTKLRSALRKGSNRFRNLEEDAPTSHEEGGNIDASSTVHRPKSWGKKRTVQFPPEGSDHHTSKQPDSIAPASTMINPYSPSTSASDPTLWSPPDEHPPAPPREVLARTGSSVAGTSAGIVEAAKKRRKREKMILGEDEAGSTVHVQVAEMATTVAEQEERGEDDPRKIVLRGGSC